MNPPLFIFPSSGFYTVGTSIESKNPNTVPAASSSISLLVLDQNEDLEEKKLLSSDGYVLVGRT